MLSATTKRWVLGAAVVGTGAAIASIIYTRYWKQTQQQQDVASASHDDQDQQPAAESEDEHTHTTTQ